MKQGSNAASTKSEETPANTEGIFDDSQPMTYSDQDPGEQPQPEIDVVTRYDGLDDDPNYALNGPEKTTEDLPKDVKAYRELQSRADKDARELKSLQEKVAEYQAIVDEYNTVKPALRFLEQNPDIIDRHLSAQVDNQGRLVQPQQQKQPVQDLPELVAPVKPADYDKFAAYNDPESESFKYREALDDYRLAKIERAEAEIERKTKEYQDRLAQGEKEARQRTADLELNKYLAAEFQMGEAERGKFKEWANNPNPSLQDLVALWRLKNPDKVKEQPQKGVGKEFRSIVDAPGSKDPSEALNEHQKFTSTLNTGRRNLFETF